MKTEKFNVIKKSRIIIALVATVGLVVVGSWLQGLSVNIKTLSVLSEGAQTCFSRVNQSNMARLLGDTQSLYLESEFMQGTEECFSEVLDISNSIDLSLAKNVKAFAEQINGLSIQTHWFHSKLILAKGEKKSTWVDGPGMTMNNEALDSRFQNLEEMNIKILETIEGARERIESSLRKMKINIFLFGAVALFFLFWEFINQRKKKIITLQIEDEAKYELEIYSEKSNGRVGEIIGRALEVNDLRECSNLFSRFHSDVMDGRQNILNNVDFSTPQKENRPTVIDNQDAQMGDLKAIHLDGVLSKVIGMISDKLFTYGIVLDLDVDESTYVYATVEALEQVFYNVFTSSVKSCIPVIGARKISVQLKKLGTTILVDINDSGHGHSDDFIKAQAGISKENPYGIELLICQELMSDFKGKVSVENKIDADGNIQGGKIRLQFKQATLRSTSQKSKVTLVNLKRGNKKQLMAQMKLS